MTEDSKQYAHIKHYNQNFIMTEELKKQIDKIHIMKTDFKGKGIYVDKRSFKPGWLGCWNHELVVGGPGTVDYIRDLLSKFEENDVFLDMGANTGLMSLMIEPTQGRAIAVESNTKTFQVLKSNAQINPYLNIDILNMALHNDNLTYHTVPCTDWSGTDNICIDEADSQQTMKGDDLVKYFVTDKETIKVIKIDVEASSQSVLESFRETIKKFKPVLIVESYGGLREFYAEMGYENMLTMDENIIAW